MRQQNNVSKLLTMKLSGVVRYINLLWKKLKEMRLLYILCVLNSMSGTSLSPQSSIKHIQTVPTHTYHVKKCSLEGNMHDFSENTLDQLCYSFTSYETLKQLFFKKHVRYLTTTFETHYIKSNHLSLLSAFSLQPIPFLIRLLFR